MTFSPLARRVHNSGLVKLSLEEPTIPDAPPDAPIDTLGEPLKPSRTAPMPPAQSSLSSFRELEAELNEGYEDKRSLFDIIGDIMERDAKKNE